MHDSKVLTLLNRMVDAHDVELKTVTRLFKGSEYRLVKGRVIGPGLYEFTLKLMGRRPPLPDARIRVRDVSGAETWGDLLAIDGDKVILRLESNLGNLSAATMVVDLSFLIVEEKKKLLAYRDHFNTRLSRLPEAVFFGLPSKKPLNRLPANDSELDELQLSALSKSLDRSFHMVWGPPGSGKTRTLAAVALEAAKAGKKVLLTAHTHSALDSLLLQVKKGWRNDLRIVRLGHSTNPGVEEFCADVQAEKHVADLKDAVKKLEDAAAFLKTNGQALRNVLRKVLSWLDYLEYEEKLLKKEYALLQHLEKTHQQRLSQLTELRDAKPGVLDRLPIISRVARERRERQVEQLENLLNNIALNLRKTRDEINSRMKKVSIVKQALATVEEIGFLDGSVTRDSLLALISGIQRLAGENTSNTEGFVAVKAGHLHLLKEASPHLRLLLKNPDLEAELKRLKSQMQTKIYDAKLSLLRNADIVAATITKTVTEVFDLVFASGREGEPRLARFDLAVVDEASMVRLSQVWIVSSLAERVVLGGDPKQLPPIVMTSKKQHPDHYGILKTDVFSFRGVDTGSYQELSTLLEKQYRMSRKICDVVSGLFYNGRLKATRDSKGEIILFDTSHLLGGVDVPTVDGSRMNALYALTDLYAVKHLTSRFGLRDEDIAVITPYRAQAELLTSLFTDSGLYGVACGTIHTFQGMERRAVIIDLVKVGDYGRSPLLRG
ncbi:MAG: ATP-binding protein, partial [Candidatus Caldarchaeum sp.]